MASVVVAQPTREELEDVSAEETLQEALTGENDPPEEQEVFCRLPLSMPALHSPKETEKRQETVDQPWPLGSIQELQEHKSRSLEKSERSSRNNSSGSVTSRSGWKYGWGWSERQPLTKELPAPRSARKGERRPVHE